MIEEDGSPPLLGADGQGPHAQKRDGNRNRSRGQNNGHKRGRR